MEAFVVDCRSPEPTRRGRTNRGGRTYVPYLAITSTAVSERVGASHVARCGRLLFFGECFRHVHAFQGENALVPGVELRVVLEDQVNEFRPVN